VANALYPLWKEAILQASASSALNGSGTTGVYAALVTSAYTYSATDQFYSSLSGVLGTPQEITAKSYTNGLFDGADVTYTAVAGGSTGTAIVIYVKNAGANTTWRLFAYIDTGVTNLPVITNGGDITISWNASGIVQL
jgi:hypothetical protein